MRNIEELEHLVLSLDHEDINDIFIDLFEEIGTRSISLKDYEVYYDDDIVFISGDAEVTYEDFGGNDEPEYREYEVDFDVIITANDAEENEIKASFCTQYNNPKKL